MTTDAKPLTTSEIEELERLRTCAPSRIRVYEYGDVDGDCDNLYDAVLRLLPSLLASARAHASALARAEAAEADAKEAQAALDMQRDALQAMTDMCNAAEAAAASLCERVRALEEGLREVDEAFTADRKARRPHNARLHARVKALLASTKEPTPPNCDCGEPAKEGWAATHRPKGQGCMHARSTKEDDAHGKTVVGGYDAEHLSRALGWIERNVDSATTTIDSQSHTGITLVARALAETDERW